MIIGIIEPVTRSNESLACVYAILESNWTKHEMDPRKKTSSPPKKMRGLLAF